MLVGLHGSNIFSDGGRRPCTVWSGEIWKACGIKFLFSSPIHMPYVENFSELWLGNQIRPPWEFLNMLSMLVKFCAASAKSLQSCPTLCDPIDGSPLGSPVPGILQARILEWVAISFSNAWKWKVKVKLLSHVRLLATPWTAAYQAPLSMGISRQEYWSGLPLPSPKVLCS